MGRLILIRHCETKANAEGVIQGREDPPLSERGRRQAELVAGYVRGKLAIANAISSDLRRATQTAEAIGVPIKTTELLREFDWGNWEGRTWRAIAERNPAEMKAMKAADPHFTPPNGESLLGFEQRIDQAISEFELQSASADIAVISHEGTIRVMISRLLGWGLRSISNLMLFPGSVSVVSLGLSHPQLSLLNHYDHLASSYEELRLS